MFRNVFITTLLLFTLKFNAQEYQKEIAKANKWNTEQCVILKAKFSSSNNCATNMLNCVVVKTQYDLNGEKAYGPGAYNSSQKAHDKVVAREIKISGCNKTSTYSFSSGKWLPVTENTKPSAQ